MNCNEVLLKATDLHVGFPSTEKMESNILRGLNFCICPGEIVGLLGSSGCGKTLTALTIMGLSGMIGAKVSSGQILFNSCNSQEKTMIDLLKIGEEEFRLIRGRKISMISQNPVSVLNPVVPAVKQLAQTIAYYYGLDKGTTKEKKEQLESKTEEVLRLSGLSGMEKIREKYPSQLSVGMCQRIAIGLGICGSPDLLIADEPTSALDHKNRDWVFHTLYSLCQELSMSVLLITHDERKCREVANRILRIENGRVEEA